MGITDIFNQIGDENIRFQMLHASVTNVSDGKKHGKITFATTSENAQGLMRQLASGEEPKTTGMVVWVPTEQMNSILKSYEQRCEREAHEAKA